MGLDPISVLVVLPMVCLKFGVPAYGIYNARKRMRLKKPSTVMLVLAVLWTIPQAMDVVLYLLGGPFNLMNTSFVVLELVLPAYWLYAANEANRLSGSSRYLF